MISYFKDLRQIFQPVWKKLSVLLKKKNREPGISTLHGPTRKLHKSLAECMVPRLDMQNPSFFGNSFQGHEKDFQFINNNFTVGKLREGKKAFFFFFKINPWKKTEVETCFWHLVDLWSEIGSILQHIASKWIYNLTCTGFLRLVFYCFLKALFVALYLQFLFHSFSSRVGIMGAGYHIHVIVTLESEKHNNGWLLSFPDWYQ